MNWKVCCLLAGLILTTSLSACSSNPANTEQAIPSTSPSAANSQPGSAMSGDAQHKDIPGGAMSHEKPGSAMSGDAQHKDIPGGAMKH